MKKLFMTLLLVYSSISLAEREGARESGREGNGGGGVHRDGRFMTFYSAGFYTEKSELLSSEIPQLNELLQFINTNKYMTDLVKSAYMSKLIPTSTRKYFKVKADTFTPEVRERLIAEYGRVMKTNTSELALFAITDTSNGVTYLLPEYFDLKPFEQQAILFHEAHWLRLPNASYKNVINAEMSFQAYLENPSSPERLLRLLEQIGFITDKLNAAIKFDLETNSLHGLIWDKKIKLIDILGADFFACKTKAENCHAPVIQNVFQLTKKYPKSYFLALLNEELIKGNVGIKTGVDLGDSNYITISSGIDLFQRYVRTGYLLLDENFYNNRAAISIKFEASPRHSCRTLSFDCHYYYQTFYLVIN